MELSTRGDKSICLPVTSEEEYQNIIADNRTFRQYICETWANYPEIFPAELEKGFSFHDWVFSLKQQLSMRRIKLTENSEVYQLRPDFVMPYMVGKTDEIDKPMYFRQFGVPNDRFSLRFWP